MFVPFLIMLREGLEAALIVSLIASYLKRTQRGRWIGVMWIGVLLAAALCLGLGIFINETTGEFPQKEQELFEGIVAVIAVVILTPGWFSGCAKCRATSKYNWSRQSIAHCSVEIIMAGRW